MASRMDRYKENSVDTFSRSKKNKKLYSSLDDNPRYTTISDVRNANIYSLDPEKEQYKTREGYQKIKDYGDIVPKKPAIKKELDDINYLYQERGNKIYDINSVIEEAKKNRDVDINEEKRKISDEKYRITKDEIEKYRNEKLNRTQPDKEAMKELINTITSKTLSGELDQATSVDLLSDLMATTEMDRVDKSSEILDEEDLAKVKDEMDNYMYTEEDTETDIHLKNMDNSFYTKSMDLSDKDFFSGEDEDEEEDNHSVPSILKLFLLVILAALLAVLVYFIIQSF